jgi:hypothetical protein
MVRFRAPALPRADWQAAYETGLQDFERRIGPREM